MITTTPSTTVRTREQILRAAQRLIARRGEAACTVRAVASAAGITPGAIYRHFTSRDDLVAQAVNLALEGFEIQLLEAIAPLPVGSFARIGALGEAYLRFARENEQEFRVLFMTAHRGRRRRGDLFGKVGYRVLRRCVAEAVQSGEIRAEDPDLTALYFWTRVHGIVTLFMASDVAGELGMRSLDALAFFQQTRSLVIDGVRPDAR